MIASLNSGSLCVDWTPDSDLDQLHRPGGDVHVRLGMRCQQVSTLAATIAPPRYARVRRGTGS